MSKLLTVRSATIADIPLIAQIAYEATLPPTNHCFWEDLLVDTQTSTMAFIEAKFRANASNWGSATDFLILQEDGEAVAAAAGYEPSATDYRPLRLDAMAAVAEMLNWSQAILQGFLDRYEALWQFEPTQDFLRPQAPWIIEYVAVLPAARGRGLGKALIQLMLDWGRSRQYSHAGIMLINGNDAARRTYESAGFKPYQAFYADYFEGEFVGFTKFRCSLKEG
jgi:GNAT superfamily N-acetyltransferase